VTVTERLESIRERVAAAAARSGRSEGSITLVGVSKKQPEERLLEAHFAGLLDFGENYVQALLERRKRLPQIARWHFVGHLQSNKAAHLIDVALIHGLDSLSAARKLSRAAQGGGTESNVLVHVNIGGEASKSGVGVSDLPALLEEVANLPGLSVQGLMCIPPRDSEPRRHFSALRELRDKMGTEFGLELPELSMGMSGDFEAAIAEGATLVRVGQALFGARQGA
jgi:pyridoxal phosphate enzyme (YggS family)